MNTLSPNSLRKTLLGRLLPAMCLLLLCGALTAYWVAWRSATKAYDRALYDTALAIAEQLKIDKNEVQLPLSQQAQTVLLTDKYDQIYFAVRDPQGEFLTGKADLPLPNQENFRYLGQEGRSYYDAHLSGKPIRIAALQKKIDGHIFTVLAGETMIKRNALVREILFGMLVPELLLVILSFGMIWFGVRSGLQPLNTLRLELAGRSPTDLTPVHLAAPEELQPVVEELNHLLQRLDNALNSQRNFVSDAAHQLRTPIAALQAQVEAALQHSNPGNNTELKGLLKATARLSHLVDQMLALARTEWTPDSDTPVLDLLSLIQSSAEQWFPRAIRKNIDLGFDLESARLRGNEVLLQELLNNLLDNALRHTPTGGTINVSCHVSDTTIELSVEDSGPGISETQRTRIFERFFQNHDNHGASGLGLAIAREIARQHGGEISVSKSIALSGAAFTVLFSRLPGDDPANATTLSTIDQITGPLITQLPNGQ